MENRNGLILKIEAGTANGTAERDVAIDQIQDLKPGSTVGADRAHDTKAIIALSRDAGITPHVAQVGYRRSAIDGRTTLHAGFEISMIRRRMIKGCFGWMKVIGNCRRTRFRGVPKTNLLANITAAAYDLARMARSMPEPRVT